MTPSLEEQIAYLEREIEACYEAASEAENKRNEAQGEMLEYQEQAAQLENQLADLKDTRSQSDLDTEQEEFQVFP